MIRVLVVEDQKIMQKYFEYMLSQEPEFKHVQTVADAEEAVGICSYSAIDIVLMDVQTFHNHDGLKAGKAIREACPHTKILIVTSLIDPKDRVIRECVTNCARHAHGSDVNVTIEEDSEAYSIRITNNGELPKPKAREGGGLSSLRRALESEGCTMVTVFEPAFCLRLRMPKRQSE